MPTTAPPPKTKTTSPEASLARLQRQLADQAASNWRSWAVAVADGGEFPDIADLLSAATALGIPDAVTALREDAQAITDARSAARSAAACEKNAAEMLAPFGGDPDKVLQAIDNAKAEVERLQAIYRDAIDECGAAGHRSVLHHARVKAVRLWPDYMSTGRAETL